MTHAPLETVSCQILDFPKEMILKPRALRASCDIFALHADSIHS